MSDATEQHCSWCNYPLPAHSDICRAWHTQRGVKAPSSLPPPDPDTKARMLLAELHEAMADVMMLRRMASTPEQRQKAANAIKVWRQVQQYLRIEQPALRTALEGAASTDVVGDEWHEVMEQFAKIGRAFDYWCPEALDRIKSEMPWSTTFGAAARILPKPPADHIANRWGRG